MAGLVAPPGAPAAAPLQLAGVLLMLVTPLMTLMICLNSRWQMLRLLSHLLLTAQQLQLVQQVAVMPLAQQIMQNQVRQPSMTSNCIVRMPFSDYMLYADAC
jgi:hypothetical protein